MKTIQNYLSSFIVLMLLLSCNNEENVDGQREASRRVMLKTMESFGDAEIGIREGNKLQIVVSKKQILDYAKEALKDTRLNLTPYDYKIIEQDGQNYIRVFSNNNYVSTAELLEGENGILRIGKTVCTSTQRATGGGCVPNGVYCTPCIPPNAPGLSGDCTRTTTGS